MEYRKIIEFGKSSHVVSLPKSWMTEKNLKKGDVVYIDQDGDRLLLYPTEVGSIDKVKKTTLDVTSMTTEEIRMLLISKYIQNFNEITFISKDMKSQAKEVRALIHDMMALEVIEEDASKIVTKDFLNMDDISPVTLISKMDIITREMIADAKGAFKEERDANIAERDLDVNRLLYLLYRAIRYLQKNVATAKKNGIKQDELFVTWFAATKIERIADQAKRIAKLARRIKFNKREQEEFNTLYDSIEKYYVESMDSFYKKDQGNAFKLCMQNRKLIKQCRDFYRQNWHYESVPVVIEKMQSIIGDTLSILTYVCDMEVDDSKKQ